MENFDRSAFYCGGYFLVRANDPDWGDEWRAGLLPPKFISLSQCIGWQFKVNWGWAPDERQAALDFGIPEHRLDECLHWCAHETDVEMWSVFISPASARRFVERFDVATDDLHLIGIGLPNNPDVLEYFQQACSPEGDYGVEKQIAQHLPLDETGQAIGCEVVSYDGYGDFSHSWLCSGLHHDMMARFKIRPNAYGLIDSLEETISVYEWIKEDNMEGRRGEPEPYFPLLLMEYSLT